MPPRRRYESAFSQEIDMRTVNNSCSGPYALVKKEHKLMRLTCVLCVLAMGGLSICSCAPTATGTKEVPVVALEKGRTAGGPSPRTPDEILIYGGHYVKLDFYRLAVSGVANIGTSACLRIQSAQLRTRRLRA